jgi:8-oxo-dGTP diphosphatase
LPFEGATTGISLARVRTTSRRPVQRKSEPGDTKRVAGWVHSTTVLRLKAFPNTPALMTDCVVFEPDGRVLLVRRKHEPFAGCYALPGGFVNIGETIEAACCREVREEAGVSLSKGQLHLIGVYSDPARDPRGHSVSIAYGTTLERQVEPQAGSDAEGAEWVIDWKKVHLAFNHAEILADNAMQMEQGDLDCPKQALPRQRPGEDEVFWRALQQKLRRP